MTVTVAVVVEASRKVGNLLVGVGDSLAYRSVGIEGTGTKVVD